MMDNGTDPELTARIDVALIGVATILKLLGPEAVAAMRERAESWRDRELNTQTSDEYLNEFQDALELVMTMPLPRS